MRASRASSAWVMRASRAWWGTSLGRAADPLTSSRKPCVQSETLSPALRASPFAVGQAKRTPYFRKAPNATWVSSLGFFFNRRKL
jgi:hypothetical protein